MKTPFLRVLALVGIAMMLCACSAPTPTVPPTSEVTSEPTASTTVMVLMAARDVHHGTRVEAEDVTIVAWPSDVDTPDGALIATDEEDMGIEQAVGRIAKVDIIKGTPILDQMLTAGSEPEP